MQDLSADVTFYTDGSKACVDFQERVGFAIFSPEINLSFKKRINNHSISTIFQAEALAIEEALKIISDRKLLKSVILSDSLSVLSSLQSAGNFYHTILRIKKLLFLSKQLDLFVILYGFLVSMVFLTTITLIRQRVPAPA